MLQPAGLLIPMEPRIQYAKTKDGVSIAFWTLGEGMPLVVMPSLPWSHIQREWQVPNWRRFDETLANGRKLVRYDNRGSGMSARDVDDYSLDAHLLDLEAVADRLDPQSFSLYGYSHSVAIAIAYAARHPERVSRLVIHSGYARASDYRSQPRIQAYEALVDGDWEIFTEAAAQIYYGWGTGDRARWLAQWMRECVTREAAKAAFQEFQRFDVAPLLPHVMAPTLVLHRHQDPGSTAEISRELASTIPDARLVVLEGPTQDVAGVARAVDEFLDEGEPAAGPLPSGTAVILFADIAESTALTEQLGDAAFRSKARELDTSLRGIIREAGGTPVEGKLLGDGVLAVFTSARQAIEAALACGRAGSHGGLPLHLGVHAGDVIREEDPDGRGNVYGGAVNIAARIAAASAPGEVLVSDTVRSLARTSAGVSFEDRGEHELKGVGEPQRMFAIREEP